MITVLLSSNYFQINEQMVTMVKTSEVTLEERRERNNICFKLQTILQPFFPGEFASFMS